MDSSTDTNTMSKNEKYKLSFKQSKQKVKDWEGEFFRSNQRKPDKEEMRSAPENVQIAYKNCYKIKAYFAKAENASDTTSEVFNEDSQTLDTTVSNTKNESKHGITVRFKSFFLIFLIFQIWDLFKDATQFILIF